MIHHVLKAYGLDDRQCVVESLSTGLINATWKISIGDVAYILQKINTNVFKTPDKLTHNVLMLRDHLALHYPHYLFVAPRATVANQFLFDHNQDTFRLYPFVKNSNTLTVVPTAAYAFEAARQFAKLTRLLTDFDASQLHPTISNFHNLSFRYQQFDEALQHGNKARIAATSKEISQLRTYDFIVEKFEEIDSNDSFIKRVTHHDTKIGNVLFDYAGTGLCVIDLDTIMSGYFISDVGDMIRTYVSPANEEEQDLDKIEVRDAFFRAIVHGYLKEMGTALSGTEKRSFVYAGLFLTYMQAIRFLTDYINDDRYYGAQYEGHNLMRARNQLRLLQKMIEKEAAWEKIVEEEVNHIERQG